MIKLKKKQLEKVKRAICSHKFQAVNRFKYRKNKRTTGNNLDSFKTESKTKCCNGCLEMKKQYLSNLFYVGK